MGFEWDLKEYILKLVEDIVVTHDPIILVSLIFAIHQLYAVS